MYVRVFLSPSKDQPLRHNEGSKPDQSPEEQSPVCQEWEERKRQGFGHRRAAGAAVGRLSLYCATVAKQYLVTTTVSLLSSRLSDSDHSASERQRLELGTL